MSNLKPLTELNKLISNLPAVDEGSFSFSGREVEVDQVQAGVDFNPIISETPVALEEREVSPLEEDKISPYFANEELVNIFSYLGKLNKEYLLSICKELREYFFDTKFIIVNFEISKFLKLESEKQSEIINLIQKTDVRLSIMNDRAFETLTTILSQQPFIFGDAQDSLKKIIQLTLSLMHASSWPPILNFLRGCKFLKTLCLKLIGVGEDITFTVPEVLTNLRGLYFDYLRAGATVKVPKALKALETLSLSSHKASNVSIEEGMPALKALHYEEIARFDGGIIEVPKSLPALETLSFGSIRAGHVFIPGDLPALTSIFFGKVYPGVIAKNTITLKKVEGGFPALKSISFGSVCAHRSVLLSIVMPENLKQYIVNLTPDLEDFIEWV